MTVFKTALAEQFDSTGAGPVARCVRKKFSGEGLPEQWKAVGVSHYAVFGGEEIHLTQKKMMINYSSVFFKSYQG